MKVYLVDDEFYVRTSLRRNLPWEDHGFEVVGEANNGKSALEDIMVLRPDIAIVDINMPIYDGLELIRRLQENKIPCRCIILTGYNEFSYAQQALRLGVYDYILKPIDYILLMDTLVELGNEICSTESLSKRISDLELEKKERLLEQYYNDLISCSSAVYKAVYDDQDILAPEDFILDYKAYCIAVIQTSMPLGSDDFKEISGVFPFRNYICCCDSQKRIFLILDSSDKKALVEFLESCIRELKKLNYSPHVGIGTQCSSLNLVYRSYNEAIIALRNNCLLKKGITFYDELDNAGGYQKVEAKLQHRLKACVLEKNISGTQRLLTEFYDSFLPGEYMFHSLIFNTIELVHMLVDTLSTRLSMPVSVLNSSDSILDILNGMTDVRDIKNWIIKIYTAAMQNFLLTSAADSGVTAKIETFIQENYSNPEFSIPLLSDALFLNYSYLCACFKRDKHMTINDYLNNLRIEKAVEFFQNGVINVTYVAEKTGFNNAGYFSKKFKKEIGLSPSEYIKTLKK